MNKTQLIELVTKSLNHLLIEEDLQKLESPVHQHCENALKTLQEMLGSDNKENPWLGVTAALALEQEQVSTLE